MSGKVFLNLRKLPRLAVLVGLAFTPGQNGQLLAVNVGDEKAFKSLDGGSVFSFAGPGQTGKGVI